MVWFAFAGLTAVIIIIITRPLGAKNSCADDSGADIAAYAAQLGELDKEGANGTLSAAELHDAKSEVARRLLRLSGPARKPVTNPELSSQATSLAFIVIAAVVAGGSLSLYGRFGGNGYADQPLEARLNAPVEKQSLEIQVANVERQLRANPKDGAGWGVIAPIYFRMGQFEKSTEAYKRLISIAGENEDRLLGLAESLTFAAGGSINESAQKAIGAALLRNPKSLRARFWSALLTEQEGRTDQAADAYRALLADDVPTNWKKAAEDRLAGLATNAGASSLRRGNATADTGSETGGQANVLNGDQGEMIRGMVSGLASRLKENGADLQGWLRLIRSYVVLRDRPNAISALASAEAQFKDDPKALSQIRVLASGLGLKQASSETSPKL